MNKPKVKLILPDKNQCQATCRTGSFMSFGIPSETRCENKPSWIAQELKPRADGMRGSMSLCSDCRKRLEAQLGKSYCIFRRIE